MPTAEIIYGDYIEVVIFWALPLGLLCMFRSYL